LRRRCRNWHAYSCRHRFGHSLKTRANIGCGSKRHVHRVDTGVGRSSGGAVAGGRRQRPPLQTPARSTMWEKSVIFLFSFTCAFLVILGKGRPSDAVEGDGESPISPISTYRTRRDAAVGGHIRTARAWRKNRPSCAVDLPWPVLSEVECAQAHEKPSAE
jgi:hypothetical protein